MRLISIQAMVVIAVMLSLAVFVMVLVESGLDERRIRKRRAARLSIRKCLSETGPTAAGGDALDRLLGRHHRIDEWDMALLEEVSQGRTVKGVEYGCVIEGMRRRNQYVRTLNSARYSQRVNAAELLLQFGCPSVVPGALKAVLGRRWGVDVYLAILAAVRWVEDESDARLVWLALIGYENVRPRLAAEIMMSARIDLVPTVKDFLAGVDRLRLGALEYLLMRTDLVEAAEPDWESLLTDKEVDVVCAGIRLYVKTHKQVPPRRDYWWCLEEARIAFVGSASWIEDVPVREMVVTAAASDPSWWVRYRANESLVLIGWETRLLPNPGSI